MRSPWRRASRRDWRALRRAAQMSLRRQGTLSSPLTAHGSSSSQEPKNRSRSKVIDKSVLALPEPRRVRDRDHVRYVAKQPCLVCGRQPSDPHHLRFAQSRALGRKVSDEFTVPLCRGHHREVHRSDDEAAWWRKAGIDPMLRARALWLKTHPLPTTAKQTLTARLQAPPSAAIRESPKPIGRCADAGQITKRSQLSRRLPSMTSLSPDRGQSSQRTQKHRSEYRRRKTPFASQRRSPWAYRGNGH